MATDTWNKRGARILILGSGQTAMLSAMAMATIIVMVTLMVLVVVMVTTIVLIRRMKTVMPIRGDDFDENISASDLSVYDIDNQK